MRLRHGWHAAFLAGLLFCTNAANAAPQRVVSTFLCTDEYVFRLVPRGTHEYERLVRPSELAQWGRAAGLELQDVSGLAFDPFTAQSKLSPDASVNYLAHFTRRT